MIYSIIPYCIALKQELLYLPDLTQLGRQLYQWLDDFEQNIPTANIEDGSLRMTADAYEILGAICAALAENGAESRLIVTCRYLKEDTLPPHRLHLESLAGMNSSDIDKICFPLDREVRQQLRTRRIIKIADGNPRLLKWLLEVIQQPGLAADELLNRLEATEQKFREDILAQTLLDALEPEEQKFLARLSVFHLPVTVEIINAITATPLPFQKLISLSLVESASTQPTQPANYRVTTILESLLKPVLSDTEWQATRQQAVKKIYQLWWEESNQSCTDEQALEVLRLGLIAGEQEVAAKVSDIVATDWVNKSRFLEAVQLCQQVLAVFQDYRIFGTIARAEYFLGFVENAVVHYQQALNLCPDDDVTEKAGTLGNLAWVIAQQGDIERALFLYQQSLEISERISDVRGKAITLQNMAGVIAEKGDIERALFLYQQTLELLESVGDFSNRSTTLNNIAKAIADLGDIERAVSLWHESLKISQSIGDVRYQAEILTNLAYIAGKTGDKDRQLDLNLQALQLCVKIRAYRHLVTVITNLGEADESKGLIYFAQATWLCLNIQVPLPNTMTIFAHLYQALPQGNELQALLTTTTLFLCSQLDEDHPLFKELQILGGRMIIALTEAQGIETQQAFDTWIVQQRLNEPKYFLPRLNQRLEEIVGDRWLFDRSQVSMSE